MVKWIDSTSCEPCFDILWCYTSSVGFFEQPQPFPLVYHVVWTSRHEFTANTVEGPVQRTVDGLVQRTALAVAAGVFFAKLAVMTLVGLWVSGTLVSSMFHA